MKRKIGYAVMVCLFSVILTMFMPQVVNAAVPPMTEQNFDYAWYLKQHPELATQINSNDYHAIWNSYLNVGIPAGWHGRISRAAYVTQEKFDVNTFLSKNPDVLAVVGSDPQTVYNWYLNVGAPAGRRPYTTDENINAVLLVYDVADSITKPEMSDRERIKAAHDWIANNTSYSTDKFCASEIGVMEYHKAVCSGYANTFSKFMDAMGIESEVIMGFVTDSKGPTGGHSWNRVKLDGNWSYIDVLWDDPINLSTGVGSGCRYNYFLISEEQMNRGRTSYRTYVN